MMKQGGSVKTMKRRYFVLRGLALAYYKTDQDTGPQGTLPARPASSTSSSCPNRPAGCLRKPQV